MNVLTNYSQFLVKYNASTLHETVSVGIHTVTFVPLILVIHWN